ncbi:hypothetical protein F5888DRAFT_1609144 [Russula emetica]|nr:hypothetical protein F5888DRAFT_1609144 [Russula emetica]
MLSAYSESDCCSTVISLDLDNARPAPNVQTPTVRPTRSPFSSIFLGQVQAVRKPIIYLYPPSRLPDVTVKLLLTSSWSSSVIYPLPQTAITSGKKQIAAQSLTWTVDAEPDGRLVDKTSGTEVTSTGKQRKLSYAHEFPSHHTRHLSRNNPIEDIETFDPSRPSLSPGNSILLPIGKIPGYLDMALKGLTLHTEARTFHHIRFLSSSANLLKHEYIALHFVAQSSYEKAAQMCISPTPDVVTRVFMLFRGVHLNDVGLWAPAATRTAAEDSATFWLNVVGVDAICASDHMLFQVLEWGGMKVE